MRAKAPAGWGAAAGDHNRRPGRASTALKGRPGVPIRKQPTPTMSISGVSSSSAAASPGQSPVNVAQLQKQIAQLQKEIQTEQNSKDDAKTKLQLVTAYQEQIVELQQEIQEAQQQQALKASQTAAAANPDAPDSAESAEGKRRRERSTDTSRYLDTQA